MPLDPRKLSVVHVAKTRLGMTDADYRDMLRRVAFVESARDLDDTRFNQVMAEFQRLGFKSDFAERNFGDRKGRATPRQIGLIRGLWSEYSGDGTEKQLRHWLENHFKAGDLRFLDSAGAVKAIAALRAMVARRAKISA